MQLIENIALAGVPGKCVHIHGSLECLYLTAGEYRLDYVESAPDLTADFGT